MALTHTNAVCTECRFKFKQIPEQSVFGFQKLICPKCQKPLIYPLSKSYRISYWLIFGCVVLLIINAFFHGNFAYPGVLGLVVVLALIKDISISKRISETKNQPMNNEPKFEHHFNPRKDKMSTSAADEQNKFVDKNSFDKNENGSSNDIYLIIGDEIARKEYQQGLMARAIAEAQGNKDIIQSLYIKFRHEELSNNIEQQQHTESEHKMSELAEKRQQYIQSLSRFSIAQQPWVVGIVAVTGLTWLASALVSNNAPPVNVQIPAQNVIAKTSEKDEAARTRKAAEQGDASAQYKLGVMYRDGKGITKDTAQAVAWFHKAAQGNADGQFNLGYSYESGQGIAKDEAQAALWYRRAAEQGHITAQFNLGKMYTDGRGVAKDDVQAMAWYFKAAKQGNAGAQTLLGNAYATGQAGIAQDDAQAVIWYRKAAEQGNAEGQNNLGSMYEVGRGIKKDEAQAVVWYRKAAEQRNPEGQNNLGNMYEVGKGITKDDALAVAWFRKAAEQGNADAQFNLGNMYEDGRGVAKDVAQAVAWYYKAAEQGNEEAQEALRQLAN